MRPHQRITTRAELRELARQLGVRPDWHEPDGQEVDASVIGTNFDNAGTWGPDCDVHESAPHREISVLISQTSTLVAEVNLATLFAWAAGYEGE